MFLSKLVQKVFKLYRYARLGKAIVKKGKFNNYVYYIYCLQGKKHKTQ